MNPRVFLYIDPRKLRLRFVDALGADPYKLQRQIAQHGKSSQGMPPLLVYRGIDGELLLYNGLTRATRLAKLCPGTLVCVEVLEDKNRTYANNPLLGDTIP